jgi:hypothetical protein
MVYFFLGMDNPRVRPTHTNMDMGVNLYPRDWYGVFNRFNWYGCLMGAISKES